VCLIIILKTGILSVKYIPDNQHNIKILQKKQKKCLCISKMVVPLHPQSKEIRFFFKVGPVVQFG
jgi:hypothetical protein